MVKFLKVSIIFTLSLIFAFTLKNLFYQYIYISKIPLENSLQTVKECEKVILFHVPFSPYTKQAIERMLESCKALEDEKLYCYETLRTSLIQIKSFYQPYNDILDTITPILADLRSRLMLKQGSSMEYVKLYENQLSLIKYDNTPSNFWSFVTSLSLVIWISSLIYGIYRSALTGILGFIIFFIVWIIGLYKA